MGTPNPLVSSSELGFHSGIVTSLVEGTAEEFGNG
jgi:hypothetical protein